MRGRSSAAPTTLPPRVRSTQSILATDSGILIRSTRMLKQNVILRSIVAFFLIGFCFASTSMAGEAVVGEMSSRTELLKGEARGVSVTDNGTLTLAARFDQLFNTEQAYVWCAASDSAGNVYLGTGHDGKIFRVTPDGKGTLFYKASELRSEEHTSELQSHLNLVCRLLLEKKNTKTQ